MSTRSTDVVIVGAGFAGCATAWALAQRGVRAVVLEREPELGRHASGRGAGLGRQLAEDDDTSRLTIRGAAVLRDRFAAHWRETGGLLAFDDPAACAAYVARARSLDLPHEVIDRAAVLRHWPQLDGLAIANALLIPRDGVIDVRGLLRSYARDLTIECGAQVQRVAATDHGVRIEIGDFSTRDAGHVIEARCMVDASGAWAGAVTDDGLHCSNHGKYLKRFATLPVRELYRRKPARLFLFPMQCSITGLSSSASRSPSSRRWS